jgi:hypothetical protein
VQEVIRRVQEILNPKDWFDMATKADLDAVIKANLDDIARAVWELKIADVPDSDKPPAPTQAFLRWANRNAGKAVDLLEAPADPAG